MSQAGSRADVGSHVGSHIGSHVGSLVGSQVGIQAERWGSAIFQFDFISIMNAFIMIKEKFWKLTHCPLCVDETGNILEANALPSMR